MQVLVSRVCPSTTFQLRLFLRLFERTQMNVRTSETGLSNEQPFSPHPAGTINALNPNQAFAKTAGKRTVAKRASRQKRGGPSSNRTVLVVDDVADVTEMIALFLKHAGYNVTTANSAGAALQLVADRDFDLVISDIGMPEMNGYELAESLRSRSNYRTVPLIAVTGYTEYDDRGRSLKSGFNAHLTKPINPSQLLDLIRELLG